ncbi:MAG: hypothetical protein WHT07_10800 [Desulfobaccales bacterium]
MAYLGSELELVAWAWGGEVGESLDTWLVSGPEDGDLGEPSIEDSPRGFIIRNWFGPFLLGPASRYLRGRC